MDHTDVSSCRISTDKSELDVELIHRFLAEESYWAQNIPMELVQKSIDNSMCFGVYCEGSQVGFARVITDFSTFAYLADVFILSSHRGHGLSKKLMKFIMSHPDLLGLRRWMLATQDAHTLYEQFGWKSIAEPERLMAITLPNLYSAK